MDHHVVEVGTPVPTEGSFESVDLSIEGCLAGAEALASPGEGAEGDEPAYVGRKEPSVQVGTCQQWPRPGAVPSP